MKKWNLVKKALTITVTLAVSICSVFPAMAGNWELVEGDLKYRNDDGSYSGGWANEEFVMNTAKNMQSVYGWEKNPIRIYSSDSAGYGKSHDVVSLTRNGCEFQFDFRPEFSTYPADSSLESAIYTDANFEGLRALCFLLPEDMTIYNYLIYDYENKVLPYDVWTKTDNGFSMLVHQEGEILRYQIKFSSAPETGGSLLETSWPYENEALRMGKEMQENRGLSLNPIKIYPYGFASYGEITNAIELKRYLNGYRIDIHVGLSNPHNAAGLKALCALFNENDDLYNYIMSDYENENLQKDVWTETAYGYSIKVQVKQGCVTYFLR